MIIFEKIIINVINHHHLCHNYFKPSYFKTTCFATGKIMNNNEYEVIHCNC